MIQPLTKREHPQFGFVAISRAAMVDVNKEMLFAYLRGRYKTIHIESRKRNREEKLETSSC